MIRVLLLLMLVLSSSFLSAQNEIGGVPSGEKFSMLFSIGYTLDPYGIGEGGYTMIGYDFPNFNLDYSLKRKVATKWHAGLHLSIATNRLIDMKEIRVTNFVTPTSRIEELYTREYIYLRTIGLGYTLERTFFNFIYLYGGLFTAARTKVAYLESSNAFMDNVRSRSRILKSDDPQNLHTFDFSFRFGAHINIFKGVCLGLEGRQGINRVLKDHPETRYLDWAPFISYRLKL